MSQSVTGLPQISESVSEVIGKSMEIPKAIEQLPRRSKQPLVPQNVGI